MVWFNALFNVMVLFDTILFTFSVSKVELIFNVPVLTPIVSVLTGESTVKVLITVAAVEVPLKVTLPPSALTTPATPLPLLL